VPGAVAVRVTGCAVRTEATLAVKLVLLELTGITTVAGTVTAASLLVTLTLTVPLAEAALSTSSQVSVTAPITVALEQ
jgi:hypothetical protein